MSRTRLFVVASCKFCWEQRVAAVQRRRESRGRARNGVEGFLIVVYWRQWRPEVCGGGRMQWMRVSVQHDTEHTHDKNPAKFE